MQPRGGMCVHFGALRNSRRASCRGRCPSSALRAAQSAVAPRNYPAGIASTQQNAQVLRRFPANSQFPNGPTESSAPTTPIRTPCSGGRLRPPARIDRYYGGLPANSQLPHGPMCTGKRQTHIRNAPSSRTAVTGIGPYKRISNISQYNAQNRHSPQKAVPVPYLQIISSLCSRKYGSPPENRKRYVSMCDSRSPVSSPDRICARSVSHSASPTGCSVAKNVSCIV